MPRVTYVEKKFNAAHLKVIERANAVCAEYEAQGLVITLRQLYYQFVSRLWIPNTDQEYKKLGRILGHARMAGLLDWNYMIDRTRYLRELSHWTSVEELVAAAASQYRTDRWADQPTRVQVWIEKDAAIGVIEGVCNDEQVPYFSCRGYTSMSEMWVAAQRLRRFMATGQDVVILHIGDHDPSGVDMSRDIEERLRQFLRRDLGGARHTAGSLEVRRIALTYDQVELYEPPPNPAKQTDARYRRYVADTGLDESWELDALDPAVLQDLIRTEIEGIRDDWQWENSTAAMEHARSTLVGASARWDEVVDLVNGTPE